MNESSTSGGGAGISNVPSRGSPFGSIIGFGKFDMSIAPHSWRRHQARSAPNSLKELPANTMMARAFAGRITRASLTKLTEGRICPYVALAQHMRQSVHGVQYSIQM